MKSFNTNLAVIAAITLGVAACGGGSGGGMAPAPTPAPANTAPGISAITDKISDQDTAVAVDFTIQDLESDAGSLTVSAAADGTALFPADGVVLSGSGATRTLTLTPLEATTGTATVSVRVQDPQGAVATRSFQVAVNVKEGSILSIVPATFAKGESDPTTEMNGWTAKQDADAADSFAALIPAGDE